MLNNSLILAAGPWDMAIWFGIIVLVLGGLIFFALFARYVGLWIQCKTTGAGIGIINLFIMSIRKVNPSIIARSKIMAVQAGLTHVYPISTRDLEAHYLAGGNVPNVIRALIAAHRASIDLDWITAAAIDLAGRDILEAVRTSVYPKVIDCPDPKKGAGTLDAVAGDGIQLKARARVTVRTNIKQLIGGATEETIIARVGQGIVQAIGSNESYADVLENPDRISQTVLNQGLEAQTAFEIVSIDIADIDVGDNIGARLQADQAEADMNVAQAKAEERRAEAKAREQEMVAKTQENRAQVVLAEAEVPAAIVAAFKNRTLGIMDYYELKNVQADTQMRTSIAGSNGDQVDDGRVSL
ncbi:flotillin-like protein FloA [Rubinisphaera italica]|uniref:Flotillin-like protein FloA n=1 Tax=Rubinisphaera italica TaxID=2527969 RepID=A0A5C5X9H9_9PLAN|nr:flotillin-like protein FloA [Rubinisphaera italica]TWT59807.1 SigmaW regulon antibacterial [Rubinisphaera italica]